jgi:predicted transcriptional regulator
VKVAISLPDPVFDAAEQLAGELKLSRSQLYADALAAYLAERGAAAVTARLDAVHGERAAAIDPALARAQRGILDDEAW